MNPSPGQIRSRQTLNDAAMMAAVKWWGSHCPVGMTMDEHLKNVTINCSTQAEMDLARAVAACVAWTRR